VPLEKEPVEQEHEPTACRRAQLRSGRRIGDFRLMAD